MNPTVLTLPTNKNALQRFCARTAGLLAALLICPTLVLAADVSSPETWADSGPNSTVNGARLNNAFNGITILPAFVSGKPAAVPTGTDLVLFYQVSSLALKQCSVAQLSGPTSVGLALPSIFSVSGSPLTTSGTITATLATQSANRFLAGPANGSALAPTFRLLAAQDMAVPTVTPPAANIDWSAANTFIRGVSTNTAFTFSNTKDGQTIVVALGMDAAGVSVTWPTVLWSGGVPPTATAASGRFDVYCFIKVSGVIFGSINKNFF